VDGVVAVEGIGVLLYGDPRPVGVQPALGDIQRLLWGDYEAMPSTMA